MPSRQSRRSFGRKLNKLSSSFERLEERRMLAADVQTYDGTANNQTHLDWGSAGISLLRMAASAYADGLSSPAGASRPSARAISNIVNAHPAGEIENNREMSAFVYAWGQFIDHDIDLTTSATPSESFNISVPTGDPYFDPDSTGTQVIPLSRSKYTTGTGNTSPREQVNDITSWIDASMVYGSDVIRAAALRTFIGGTMKTSAGNLLPYNTMGLVMDTSGGAADSYFAAGDQRANENIELTAMQTLFVREHNRLATQIAQQNPTWTDEQIYQRARRLVSAEIQAITYNEFLPALLGPNALQPYNGYHSNVNPGIANEFSTAAFRLGHSMLEDDVEFLDNNGHDTHDAVSLADAFFNPALLATTGVDPILKYLASTNSEEIDTKIVDSLRNFLFGPPGSGGLDLASLNIQRGRDHGLADYNTTRAALGLPRLTSFAQITPDTAVQAALQQAYGNVDNIDLWVGGLAEQHVPGSSVGPTFQRILTDQFTRLRDADRFFYLFDLTPPDRQMIQNTHLADIIARNTTTTNLQPNVFTFDVTITGRVFFDGNGDGILNNGETGIAGRQIYLTNDATGAVVQTATTDATGLYTFDDVGLGDFTLTAQLPPLWRATSAFSRDVSATRAIAINAINFGQSNRPRSLGDGGEHQVTIAQLRPFGAAPTDGSTNVLSLIDDLSA